MDWAKVLETVAAGVTVVGGMWSGARWLRERRRRNHRQGSYLEHHDLLVLHTDGTSTGGGSRKR